MEVFIYKVNFCCQAKWFTHTHIHTLLISFSTLVYHKILNIVPCAIQENLVVYPFF